MSNHTDSTRCRQSHEDAIEPTTTALTFRKIEPTTTLPEPSITIIPPEQDREVLCCCLRCKCKLSIIALVISASATFVQILLIYLDKIDSIHNILMYQIIVAVLNATLAAINAVQLGIRIQAQRQSS